MITAATAVIAATWTHHFAAGRRGHGHQVPAQQAARDGRMMDGVGCVATVWERASEDSSCSCAMGWRAGTGASMMDWSLGGTEGEREEAGEVSVPAAPGKARVMFGFTLNFFLQKDKYIYGVLNKVYL